MGHPGSGIPRCGHGLRACGWPGRWSLVLLGDEPDTARGKRWFWNGCSTGSGTVALWHETKQCFASVILCAVDPVRWVPRNNVIFVGLVALLGAFLLSYSLATEMLNFGALLAFIGVNAAAFVRYFVRASAKRLANLVLPDFRSDDLLAALAKPEPGGNAGGRALDGCWHCVRRVENARVSHGFDQFRDPLRGGDLNENNDRLRVLLRRKLLGTNHESCRGHGFGVFSGKPVGLGSLRLTALVPPAQYRRDDKNEIHHAS